ncbi:MAG: hypothetical protein ACK5JM_05825 [Rhodoblastus sp.]
MKILLSISFAAALSAAPLCAASAQSLPGGELLGKAQAAHSAASAVKGNPALSGAARDMAVKEATGSIKNKAGDYAKNKALGYAAKNPKLTGKALEAHSRLGQASKLKGMKPGDAKSMAVNHGKAKAKDAAMGAVTRTLGQ